MRFPGIIPAVTTPFAPSGAVDTAALQANVRGLLDAGVHGIVGTGTMGEAGSLSTRERRDGLADRGAADLESLGQVALGGQALPGTQQAHADLAGDPVGDPLVELRRLKGP